MLGACEDHSQKVIEHHKNFERLFSEILIHHMTDLLSAGKGVTIMEWWSEGAGDPDNGHFWAIYCGVCRGTAGRTTNNLDLKPTRRLGGGWSRLLWAGPYGKRRHHRELAIPPFFSDDQSRSPVQAQSSRAADPLGAPQENPWRGETTCLGRRLWRILVQFGGFFPPSPIPFPPYHRWLMTHEPFPVGNVFPVSLRFANTKLV